MKYTLTGHILNWTFHIVLFWFTLSLFGMWAFYFFWIPYFFLKIESSLDD